jgi:hypothetical protein
MPFAVPVFKNNGHVIRDDDLNRIRAYIANTPVNGMQDDLFFPLAFKKNSLHGTTHHKFR